MLARKMKRFGLIALQICCVLAVQNEADLQSAYTSAITAAQETPTIQSGGPIDLEFTDGRATNYFYNQNGACGFSDINADESLGSPLYIMAIPDCAPSTSSLSFSSSASYADSCSADCSFPGELWRLL